VAADDNLLNSPTDVLALTDETVVRVLLRTVKAGEDELRIRARRYNHSYDVWRASERRPASLEPWQSKLRVPYGLQSIDTALVNIVGSFPRCLVKPRHPDVELNAKAMQIVLDYFIREDHMAEAQPVFAQQGLVYGTTAAKIHWLYRTATRTRNDHQTGKPITEDVVVRDGPTFEPWNIYDIWWDPNARDVDRARYVVLRSWLSKDQLIAQACTVEGNHDSTECTGIYHNVDQLLKVGPTEQRIATAQLRYLGGGSQGGGEQNRFKDLFELLEVWTDDTVSTIGSRQVLIRNEANPYWHQKKPIVVAQQRIDFFEMWGIPETELIDHLQSGMWTLQNMVIDNLHLTTMRGVTYREGGVTDPNKLQLRPRFKWPVVDHDDIRPFEIPPVSTDVYTERQRMLQDMQLVTGINPYVSGADMQAVDQNTATGVTALQEVASRLLRFKAQMFQYKGYQRSFEMWGDMIQQFLDHDIFAKITGPQGEEAWMQVGPADVAGHFDYVLDGTEESLSRQQERGEALALLNAFAPMAQLGIVNYKPILERVALAYDFPNPEALWMQPPPQPPAAPTGQNGNGNGQSPPFLYNVMQPRIGAGQQGPGVSADLASAMGQVFPQG
jgi:hypothetical protein